MNPSDAASMACDRHVSPLAMQELHANPNLISSTSGFSSRMSIPKHWKIAGNAARPSAVHFCKGDIDEIGDHVTMMVDNWPRSVLVFHGALLFSHVILPREYGDTYFGMIMDAIPTPNPDNETSFQQSWITSDKTQYDGTHNEHHRNKRLIYIMLKPCSLKWLSPLHHNPSLPFVLCDRSPCT